MAKYKKIPVVIDAIKWKGNNGLEIANFCKEHMGDNFGENGALQIHTLNGTVTANIGDWLIRGVDGEYYSCDPDTFEKTYEPA